MVTNVTSLLKTVKAVEDEHTRGTRALESTIEAIGQEMRVIFSIFFEHSHIQNKISGLIFERGLQARRNR